MGRLTIIEADGTSAVTRFFGTLVYQHEWIESFAWRDAEALRILTATPALREAITRDCRRDMARRCDRAKCPRIWTRRDEKRLASMRGWRRVYDGPYVPECRLARFLQMIERGNWHELYRLAKTEVAHDGTAARMLPLLGAARDSHEKLLSAVREQCESSVTPLPTIAPALSEHNQALGVLSDELPTPKPRREGDAGIQRVTAKFLGNGRYEVGGTFICLDDAQAAVLQSLVELRVANISQLKERSGADSPPAILKAIRRQHPAIAPHIILPGGKGRGGYSTAIVDARHV